MCCVIVFTRRPLIPAFCLVTAELNAAGETTGLPFSTLSKHTHTDTHTHVSVTSHSLHAAHHTHPEGGTPSPP